MVAEGEPGPGPARGWAGALGAVGAFLALDVLLAGALYVLLTPRLVPRLLADVDHRVLGGLAPGEGTDTQGTAWFYWWFHQAHERGVDVLHPDVVCAPGGTALGSNFPQQLDAWLALPFVEHLPFPAWFDVFSAATLTLSALAGHLGLRAVTRHRPVAFAGGLLFGFSGYSIHQLAMGRPTMALTALLPLAAGAFVAALRTTGAARWAWAVAAGLGAGLAAQHYVVYGGLLAALIALLGLLALASPPPRTARLQVLGVLALVAALAFVTAAPYLQDLLVRRQLVAVSGEGRGGPWGVGAWVETVRALLASMHGSGHGGRLSPATVATLDALQQQSLPVEVLWGGVEHRSPPRAYLPPAVLVAVLALLPWGRQRAAAWLWAALGFASLLLGPWISRLTPTGTEALLVGGQVLTLPTWFLGVRVPWLITVWHPERAAPLVLLCLIAGMAAGFDGLGRAAEARVRRRWGRGWPAWLLPLAGAALVAACALRQQRAAVGEGVVTVPWEPHPFLLALAEEEGEFSVVDLPLGLGHGLGAAQIVHGRPRANGHHDDGAQISAGVEPLPGCYELPLLRALWDQQRVDLDPRRPDAGALRAAVFDRTTPAALRQARDAGFRYVLFFRGAFGLLDPRDGGHAFSRRNLASVRGLLGPPVQADDVLAVWSLDEVVAWREEHPPP